MLDYKIQRKETAGTLTAEEVLFQTLTFEDNVTGKIMIYNLYIPADDDQRKSYPLVLFMADGSTTGEGSEAPLKQGFCNPPSWVMARPGIGSVMPARMARASSRISKRKSDQSAVGRKNLSL